MDHLLHLSIHGMMGLPRSTTVAQVEASAMRAHQTVGYTSRTDDHDHDHDDV